MNKKIPLILLFILTASAYLFSDEKNESEKINIALLPVINSSGHREINKASEKLRSVSEQTLLLLGKYNVINEENSINPEDFHSYCRKNNADYIIFGNISKEGKKIVVEMSVYGSGTGSVIIKSTESAVSPVQMRNAVKKSASSVLSRLSGSPVNFTSLAFTNMTDEKGDYQVYIDNILFGNNIDYLELLLSGTRNIKIMQNRMFGPYNASEINVLLLPEDRVSIEFKIPPLLDKEKKYIERYSKTLEKHLNDKYYSQKVSSSFKKLFNLLKNPSFSTTAAGKKEKISDLNKKWLLNMKEWETEKGFTTADKPASLGFKTMFLISSFDINDWDTGGTDPEGNSASAMGYGFTGSVDIFKFLGIQGEVLVCNQKTKTLYPTAYMPGDFSEIETSTWFTEAPAVIYLRAPESLFKIYGGVSYKYRITPLRIEGLTAGTGETVSEKYDDELLRMHLPAWLTGFILEFPFKNSIFSLDFRYNRDFKSWFRSGTPEEDYITDYFACGLGYSAKF